MSRLSDMSFIVSSSLDASHPQQEHLLHGKHPHLIMNGSTPRSSLQQQRLPSLDTLSKERATPPNGSAPIAAAQLYESPVNTSTAHDGAPPFHSDSSYTYPPFAQRESRDAQRENSTEGSVDGNLRLPDLQNAQRRSSPSRIHSYQHPPTSHPILSSSAPSQSDSPLVAPATPRLQHRHTLEVPRPHVTRTSKEYRTADGAADDGIAGRPSTSTMSRVRRTSLNLGRRMSRSNYSDSHLEEGLADGDATRWTEAIKQKRASRRRRKEEEDDDRVVVGTKVDQNHANWVTAYNMLTGIRFTVSRTNAKLDRDLTDADFETRHKFSFDITGNEMTPGAKYDFKFKDYAPWVFRRLREIFGIDPADYLISLTSKYILSELGSPGKSGSFFYFSRDYKYIIKTIHHGEHVFLRRILRQYYNHVDKNRNTLLSQFYGLHRVKMPWSGKKIHFVVMNNLFPPHRDIHKTFDLKGSLVGRDFKEEEIEKRPRATLKDLNWKRRNMHFEFGVEKKTAFVEQMKRDVELLTELKIMDYSMLVGIHDLGKGNMENLRDKTLRVFQPGGDQHDHSAAPEPVHRTPSKMENAKRAKELRQMLISQRPVPMGSLSSKMPSEMPAELRDERRNRFFYSDDGGFRATHEDGRPAETIYYLGIIDCLTKYNVVKKSEHFFKGLANPSRKSEISAVPPVEYGKRFVDFISSQAMPSEEMAEKPVSTDSAPEVLRTTIDSSNTDGTTLPVVEEVGETTSVRGNSKRSTGRQGMINTNGIARS